MEEEEIYHIFEKIVKRFAEKTYGKLPSTNPVKEKKKRFKKCVIM